MTMESRSTLEDGGRLGTWRKPPLAYVVAELRISPYYSLKEMIPQLQSALREYFPRTVEGSELVIDPSSPPAPQPVWQLISAWRCFSWRSSSTRSFSLHATAYVNFPDFLERWSRVLAAIRETGFNPFVERAGLRYVDMIIPGDDQQPKGYLIEQVAAGREPDRGRRHAKQHLGRNVFGGWVRAPGARRCTVAGRDVVCAALQSDAAADAVNFARRAAKNADQETNRICRYGLLVLRCRRSSTLKFCEICTRVCTIVYRDCSGPCYRTWPSRSGSDARKSLQMGSRPLAADHVLFERGHDWHWRTRPWACLPQTGFRSAWMRGHFSRRRSLGHRDARQSPHYDRHLHMF